MIKKSELTFTAIKLPLDYLMLILAGLASYYLRFEESVTQIKPVIFNLTVEKFFMAILVIAAVWLIFFAISGLYTFRRLRVTDEIGKIILACSTGMSAVIIYMFFIRQLFDSRFIVLTAWIFAIIFVVVGRFILRLIQKALNKLNIGSHKVAVIGSGADSQQLIKTIEKQPSLGLKIVGRYAEFNETTKAQLDKLHNKIFIDEIIQTDSEADRAQMDELMNYCVANNIIFKFAANIFQTRATNIEVHMLGGFPVIEIRKTKLEGWWKIIKRVCDLIFGLIFLIIASPIMLLCAIAVKIESRGPVIYKNERVKRGGTFFAYKFRSMYSNYCVGPQFAKYTDQEKILEYEKKLIAQKSKRQGPLYKILNDPRRTKVGRFMEKTSLDELPQLFNVVIGNMSLVGPRPHQAREVAKYAGYQKHVLDIKPGLTGLAQISGRSDLSFEDEVKLDTYYIENWSVKLDLWIMLKTPFVILTRRHKN
jgi:exopolysaccharide biosynthesis polyprenyl glycosylphosphotransferase